MASKSRLGIYISKKKDKKKSIRNTLFDVVRLWIIHMVMVNCTDIEYLFFHWMLHNSPSVMLSPSNLISNVLSSYNNDVASEWWSTAQYTTRIVIQERMQTLNFFLWWNSIYLPLFIKYWTNIEFTMVNTIMWYPILS